MISQSQPENDPASQECHISSIIVYCEPEHLEALKVQIAKRPQAEVHDSDESGRLIVTLETESEREITTNIDQINNLPGIINTALVYHYADKPELEAVLHVE